MSEEAGQAADGKFRVLSLAPQIKTPLSLLALVVLVLGIALWAVISQASSIQYSAVIIVVLIVGLIFAVLLGIYLLAKDKTVDAVSDFRNKRPLGKQKTFMSAPMASLSSGNYEQIREKMMKIQNEIRRKCGQLDVYWGGNSVIEPSTWDRPGEALSGTIDKIKECDHFILVLPEYSCHPQDGGDVNYCKPSSVWWEVGMAIAFGKDCTFFVHENIVQKARIPYYLRAMEVGGMGRSVPPSKLVRFSSLEDILDQIRDAEAGIFAQST